MQMGGHTFVKYRHWLFYRLSSGLRQGSLHKCTVAFGLLVGFAWLFIWLYFPSNFYGEELRQLYGPRNYITVNLETSADACGGLGNMMWRTISLHAIGKQLNRSVFFDSAQKCFYDYREEFKEFFRNNYRIFKFMSPRPEHVKVVDFAGECCRYDPPMRLAREQAQIVKIWGNYLQSFKFLRTLKAGEVRKFFEFAPLIRKRANFFAQKLFRNNLADHKFCVHTRRGDFIELGQASKKVFTEKAIDYVLTTLKKRHQNISILLFGDDKNFMNLLEIDSQVPVLMPAIKNRGVDLCFAATHCHSLLITAPTSTFSWWMGFLMAAGGPVFYYSCQRECQHVSKKDFFPPHWIPLNIDFRGRIEVDDNPF